ncbi:methyltransferase [Aestuariibacter halophilus]|uniref:Methyltransferase n=1 Tax=Fluctibacter halophilus TaxID=226011 RepID=A0ABS8G8Q9_9ALTE|nr:methyltransferase [Aestuariibacter halophilus]MCC2616962.1 methyltransferase [Aestuariibacter halophilus]
MRIVVILCTLMSFSLSATTLPEVINGDHRSAENKARDVYRKPLETLSFLGLQNDMTVIEVWPGSGWYTEILAPFVKDNGRFVAAQYELNPPFAYQRRALGSFMTLLGKQPKLFSHVEVIPFALPYDLRLGDANSADMVLTFRNVHNWYSEMYGGGRYTDAAFSAMFDVLKPGGVLGIVDHRWPDPAQEDPFAKNGYISAERIIAVAQKAGFRLEAQSDLLANPKDTHNHPNGVWSLPPVLAIDDSGKQAMLDIGESDRFLLKFVKPSSTETD